MTQYVSVLSYYSQKFLDCDLRVLQGLCFALALIIYGAYGSPTPDRFGAVEGIIFTLLVLAIGARGVIAAVRENAQGAWVYFARVLFVYGVVVSAVMAVVQGHDAGLIARDAVAFGFLILPLFFLHFFKIDRRVVLYAVLALGVLFSVRSLWDVPYLGVGEALFYLANMPSVLMAAIYCVGMAIQILVERFSPRCVPRVLVLSAIGILCVLPMIESQQRASLAAVIFSVILMMGWAVYRYPKRGAVLVGLSGVAIALAWSLFEQLYAPLAAKTDLVGANMRAEEWRAVWVAISDNPITMMFGLGWGATFSSPAVADISVNFTHGLFSSLLLKSGVIGMVLGAGYIAAIIWGVLRGVFARPVIVLAVFFPILIDVFLYASFKSLDFGVVLFVSVLFSVQKDWQQVDTGVAQEGESK